MDSLVRAASTRWLKTVELDEDAPADCWWTLVADDASVDLVHVAWPATVDDDVVVEAELLHVRGAVGALATEVVGVSGGDIDNAHWRDCPTGITLSCQWVAGPC